MRKRSKAQSTLEYVIILTAIVGGIIAVIATTMGGDNKAKSGLGRIMNQSAEKIKAASGIIGNVAKPTPGTGG